ncbi:hypothetical protein B0H13DRAFT_2348485 [Mycena leptocephala]|nr:hypothetical protein B0H13DRAFT_2348485 [Mycena leptocephala]
MKYLVLSLSALIFFGLGAAKALPLERKTTSSPGTMKGYLQLRRPVGVAEHEYPRERTTSPTCLPGTSDLCEV